MEWLKVHRWGYEICTCDKGPKWECQCRNRVGIGLYLSVWGPRNETANCLLTVFNRAIGPSSSEPIDRLRAILAYTCTCISRLIDILDTASMKSASQIHT